MTDHVPARPAGPPQPRQSTGLDTSGPWFRLADGSSDAVGVVQAVRDANGVHVGDRFLYANATVRNRWLRGMAHEDVVGRDPYELIPPLSRFRELGRHVVATGEIHSGVHEMPGPHGTARQIELRMEPLDDGFCFFSRDVTAELLAARGASDDEVQAGLLLRGAMSVLGDLVSVLRVVRGPDGSIVDEVIAFANEAWRLEYLGDPAIDPTGMSLTETVPALAEFTAQRHHVVETGDTVRIEFSSPAGRWLEVAFVRFGDGLIAVARDQTEAHRSRLELEESRRDLAEAQRIAHIGSFKYDIRTGDLAWSDELRRIFGLAPGEPIPGPEEQARRYAPEYAEERERIIRESTETGRPYEIRSRLLRPDGTSRQVHSHGEMLRDHDGRVIGVHGTVADITELVETTEALRRSEARYRALFDHMEQGLVHGRLELDADGRPVDWTFLDVNPAFLRITGAIDPIGRRMSEVSPSFLADRPDLVAQFAAAAAGGDPVTFDDYIAGLDRWLRVSVVPTVPGRFVILVDDITEARRADEERREREADLWEAQRLAHVGSWRLDPATGATVWSAEMKRIYGLDPDGPSPTFEEQTRFYDSTALAQVTERIALTMRDGSPQEIALDIRLDDGRVRHIQARIEAARDRTGNVVAVRGVAADVTEARQASLRLEQASRAEMVGRLAAGIAHDFNNVLAGIQGYADLLADTMAPGDPRLADVNAIRDGAVRAATLTRQLLAFGRRQSLQEEVVAPADVIDELTPMLRRLVPASTEIRTAHRGHPGRVLVDRGQLEQAVINLVINARDAMATGGSILIGTDMVAIEDDDPRRRIAPAGDYIRISVRDTGSGIEPDVLPHLFEPFYTTKAPGRGSGLGLSSVDGFVTQSRGFITVDSVLGSGSTFALHLPVMRDLLDGVPVSGGATDAVAAGPDAGDGAGRRPLPGRVLLVEDEVSVRTMTARMLRELGHAVIEAGDPGVALAVAEARPDSFDVVISDIVMPGMSGLELAARLTALRPDLPILFVSAYPDPRHLGGAEDPGHELLSKPFRRAELAERLEALLERVRAGGSGEDVPSGPIANPPEPSATQS